MLNRTLPPGTQEYKAMSVLALAMFGAGMAILLVGMFVLSEEAARTSQVHVVRKWGTEHCVVRANVLLS